jgi:hypothetical protein
MIASVMGRSPFLLFGGLFVIISSVLGLTKFIYSNENDTFIYTVFSLMLGLFIIYIIREKKEKIERDKRNEENAQRWIKNKPKFEKRLKYLKGLLKKGDESVKVEISKLKRDLEYIKRAYPNA